MRRPPVVDDDPDHLPGGAAIAPDLNRIPQLNTMLSGLGLGTLEANSVTTFAGRNHNWAGTTSTGARVFIKHIGGPASSAALRLQRTISVETTQLATRTGLATPRCLGWDEHARLMVFELLTPARSGAELAYSGKFDDTWAAQAGRLVGALHSADPAGIRPAPPFPALDLLDSLPLEHFVTATGGELELWRIMQQDADLSAALHELHTKQESAARTPVHCDLRLDQFLAHDGRLYLTDWEELQVSDPALDIGAYVGEWLYRAVNRIDATENDLSHDEVIRMSVAEFDKVRPRIVAFWQAYVSAVNETDPGLAERATAFAGWHQFTRAFANAHTRSRLFPIDRAAAGIGRSALMAPWRFMAPLGLGSSS